MDIISILRDSGETMYELKGRLFGNHDIDNNSTAYCQC